jgi:hypothetical protein
MTTMTMHADAGHAFDHSTWRERLAVRRRLARRTLGRAATVAAVLALGGMFHVMRWAGLLGL